MRIEEPVGVQDFNGMRAKDVCLLWVYYIQPHLERPVNASCNNHSFRRFRFRSWPGKINLSTFAYALVVYNHMMFSYCFVALRPR